MDIASELLTTLKTHLENHPIDFQGQADNMIDFLFHHYVEYVPISTVKSMESYGRVAEGIYKIITERDEARGVETESVEQNFEGSRKWCQEHGGKVYEVYEGAPDYPYNEELENCLTLINELTSTYGGDAFRTGIEAGARLVMELYGERVGITPDGEAMKEECRKGVCER